MKKVMMGIVASALLGSALNVLAASPIDGNWTGVIAGGMKQACGDDPLYVDGNIVSIQGLTATPTTEANGATSYQITGGTVMVANTTQGQNLKGDVYYNGSNLNTLYISSDTPLAFSGNYVDPTSSYPKGVMKTALMPTGTAKCEYYVTLYPN
jgi:hypothetical protein